MTNIKETYKDKKNYMKNYKKKKWQSKLKKYIATQKLTLVVNWIYCLRCWNEGVTMHLYWCVWLCSAHRNTSLINDENKFTLGIVGNTTSINDVNRFTLGMVGGTEYCKDKKDYRGKTRIKR